MPINNSSNLDDLTDELDTSDPTSDLLKKLPPAKSDDEKYQDVYNSVLAKYQPDNYDPVTGSITKGDNIYPSRLPMVEDEALRTFKDLKSKEADDQKAYNEKLLSQTPEQIRIRKFLAQGLTPPNLQSPASNLSSDSSDDSSTDDHLGFLKGNRSVASKAASSSNEDSGDDEDYSDAVTKSSASPQSSLADAIDKLLNGKNEDLIAAQQATNNNRLITGIGKAANQILGGTTHTTVGNGSLDDLAANADAPVKNLLQQNASTTEQLKQKELATKLINDQNKADPNSSISQAYRDAVEKFTGKSPGDNMSAADLDKLSPLYEKMWQANENAKNRQAQLAQAKMYKDGMMSQHQADKENQIYQFVQRTIEGAKGDSAYQQAMKDNYSATKAKSLINLYADPNNMPPQMVHTLVTEVDKMAQGGTPTLSGLSSLTPGTWAEKFAKGWSAMSNQPEAARAGAFIKQYGNYVNALQRDAQEIIHDKVGRAIEDNAGDMTTQHYNTLHEGYKKQLHPLTLDDDNQMVDVINPAGIQGQISKKNLPKALKNGYRLP